MNTTNYVQILLSTLTLTMLIASSLMNSFEKYLPTFIRRAFRYGKYAHPQHSVLNLEVPKAWFKHFYVYSSIITCISLSICVKNYVFDIPPPEWVSHVLDQSIGILRIPTVNIPRILLAMTLLTLQCIRRLYDTHFVSVFGNESKMSVVHYLVGYIHYTICVLVILAEAPGFTSSELDTSLHWHDLNWIDYTATALFIWAWFHQYKVTVILGEIVSQKYKLPNGDWFEYVSSPHNLSEIIMYTALTVLLWTNITWWFVYFWVVTNQVETALLTHQWYKSKFDELPLKRKALIPFVF